MVKLRHCWFGCLYLGLDQDPSSYTDCSVKYIFCVSNMPGPRLDARDREVKPAWFLRSQSLWSCGYMRMSGLPWRVEECSRWGCVCAIKFTRWKIYSAAINCYLFNIYHMLGTLQTFLLLLHLLNSIPSRWGLSDLPKAIEATKKPGGTDLASLCLPIYHSQPVLQLRWLLVASTVSWSLSDAGGKPCPIFLSSTSLAWRILSLNSISIHSWRPV